MAQVDENLVNWSTEWDWSRRGDEWSTWWGGTPALWVGALLPRIHAYVPAGTILEIAPGYGRWTQYLKDLGDHLVVVDMTERCINGCQERFSDSHHIDYHVNDGRSLAMIADGSIDFAFSFDSLVHAEADVLQGYLHELRRTLTPDGVGFVHHSNIGSYPRHTALARRVPGWAIGRLMRRGAVINMAAWRAESVSAELFASMCETAGLVCVTQEKVNWEYGRYLIDAFSTFTPVGSRWARPCRTLRNPLFTDEARRMRRMYAAPSFVSA